MYCIYFHGILVCPTRCWRVGLCFQGGNGLFVFFFDGHVQESFAVPVDVPVEGCVEASVVDVFECFVEEVGDGFSDFGLFFIKPFVGDSIDDECGALVGVSCTVDCVFGFVDCECAFGTCVLAVEVLGQVDGFSLSWFACDEE